MEQVSQGATYVQDGGRQRQARVPGNSRGGMQWEAVLGTHMCQGPGPLPGLTISPGSPEPGSDCPGSQQGRPEVLVGPGQSERAEGPCGCCQPTLMEKLLPHCSPALVPPCPTREVSHSAQ